jgi:hypothetical protein
VGNLARTLTLVSAVLGILGAWCIGYSVIDKFTGREYGDVTADGGVSRLPEYDTWAKKNDNRTYWGLWIITLSGVLQIVPLYISSSRRPEGKGIANLEGFRVGQRREGCAARAAIAHRSIFEISW